MPYSSICSSSSALSIFSIIFFINIFVISNFKNAGSGYDKTSMLVKLSNEAGSLVNFFQRVLYTEYHGAIVLVYFAGSILALALALYF
ncbi:MAG TPA: hypothetical protein EYP79_02955, partial [Campylobacterales bacterium]|nr:hypothetical protein [Campylobacterales bacterium]